MDNYIDKKYYFRDYEIYAATIVSAANDFFNDFAVYPNILAASQLTFDQFAIFMFPPDECSEDNDDDADDDDWKRIGGVSPKLKDTGLLMGGYICNDFSVAFHVDEEIEENTFQLRYIECTSTEEDFENNFKTS